LPLDRRVPGVAPASCRLSCGRLARDSEGGEGFTPAAETAALRDIHRLDFVGAVREPPTFIGATADHCVCPSYADEHTGSPLRSSGMVEAPRWGVSSGSREILSAEKGWPRLLLFCHPREGGDPLLRIACWPLPLDSRLRGNDDVYALAGSKRHRCRKKGDAPNCGVTPVFSFVSLTLADDLLWDQRVVVHPLRHADPGVTSAVWQCGPFSHGVGLEPATHPARPVPRLVRRKGRP
jgi:hypothetical protein